MLTTKLINSEATLNSFFEISNVQYVAGENLTVSFRLHDRQRDIRYIPNAAATVNVSYVDTSNATISVAASQIDADDRSMWTVSFTQAQTLVIATNSLQVSVDELGDTTDISLTILENVLVKNTLTGTC